MTSTSYSQPVRTALEAVDEAAYITTPDGGRLPQTSAPAIIAAMLDLLDVRPGHRVLEIGTGSGYSTALLSHLVGDKGHVTSVEVVPALITRAADLLHADGRRNVELRCGDGANGTPGHASRFDRIVAWATLPHLPNEWIRQAGSDAIIVTPVNVTDLAKTFVIVRLRRVGERLEVQRLVRGGFVEAHDQVVDEWLVPPYGADAVTRDGQGRPWWLSASWLRAEDTTASGQALLGRLITDAHTVTGPLSETEDSQGFYAWLLAARPAGLSTAALGDPVWRIGCTTPMGIALVTSDDARNAIHAGGPEALVTLSGWAQTWRSCGSPGLDCLRADLVRQEDGWLIRLTP